MHHPLPLFIRTQIGHRHNLHNQTRPARKMLRPLSGARFGIVLLPREPRAFPFIEDIFHEIFAERGVNVSGSSFLWARLDGDILHGISTLLFVQFEADAVTYVEAFHGKVVHVHPYRASPIILVRPIQFIALAQTSYPVVTP